MPQTIYHHDVTTSYPPEELKDLPGVPVYAARVLASTRPQDVAVLPPETQLHYGWIQDHYDAIGLPVAREVVFGRHEAIRRYPDHDLSVFYFGEAEDAVRPNRRWREAAAYLNSKNNFVRLCRDLGVPVPQTVCVEQPGARGIDLVGEVFTRAFPVYVKVAVSASGFGVTRCDGPKEFLGLINSLTVPFQVQEALPLGTQFLNVQYEIGPENLPARGPITFQVLQGNTHSGNCYPTPYQATDIYAVTDPVAAWAVQAGMQGVFAFDVAATPDGRFLPVECNPRWNGASYFSRVAEKLGVTEWQSLNVGFRARSFDGVSLPRDLAFSRQTKEGIVIVNWGCVGDAKLGLFVAGNEATRRAILTEFVDRYE